MARVYLGHDTRLDVSRAIKVLDPGLSRSASLMRRFENEARTMARLAHPNVVAVQDVGVDGDRAFIVMELVEGGSLHDRVRGSGPIAPRQACEIVGDVLAALDAAHRAGVVHRDVKPHNVLVARDGRVKVADFGIAQVPTAGADRTRTGAVMGTLAYMAPEQRQDASSVGPAADVYAAGATLYALVSGKEPFDLYSREIQAERFVGLPEAVVAVIERACRYRADDRYGSAAEMRGAVLAAASALPVSGDTPVPVVGPTLQPDRSSETMSFSGFDASSAGAGSGHEEREGDTKSTEGSTGGAGVHEVRLAGPTLVADAGSTDGGAAPRRVPWVVLGGVAAVTGLVMVAGAAIGLGGATAAVTTPDGAVATAVVESPPKGEEIPPDAPHPLDAPPASPEPADGSPSGVADASTASEKPSPRRSTPPPAAGTASGEPPPSPATDDASTAGAGTVATDGVAGAEGISESLASEGDRAGGETFHLVRLFVNARPSGTVAVDGGEAVAAPFDRKIPPGDHEVVLRGPDGATVTRTLSVGEAPVSFCWDFGAAAPCSR